MKEFIKTLSMAGLYRMLLLTREELKLVTDGRQTVVNQERQQGLIKLIDVIEITIDHKMSLGE